MGKSETKLGLGATASKPRHGRAPPQKQKSDTEDDLLSAIERQIIPRLLLAHGRDTSVSRCDDARLPPSEEEIEAVARMAMMEEMRPLVKRLSAMASDGLSFQSLLLQVIAPAADWLGERWSDDELTFSEVTVGAGVLERVAAALGADADPPLRHGELVVLTAAPGEQHVLPIHLLGELLREDGWAVHVDPRIEADELIELVANDDVAAVGVTCRDLGRLDDFAEFVTHVRAQPVCEDLLFVVGGNPELALRAPRFGARYGHQLEDFLSIIGSPRRDRVSEVHPNSEPAPTSIHDESPISAEGD